MVGLVSSVSTDEFNTRESRACEEPAPKVVEEQADSGEGIKDK